MCGLAGFLGSDSQRHDASLLKKMTDTLTHRGPDDAGYWHEPEQLINLGHRRLSIVDLSPAGHQPMSSPSSRYVIAFNGEIYNHHELREQLDKSLSINDSIKWRGHSDTETLLAGFEFWGIQETIEKAVGMFAMAVWDKQTQTLTLLRDRLGEKPLYYGWQGDTFLFASELKALRVHPAFQAEINRGAISLMLRHSYIPAPYSIYNGISKLRPGCVLTVSMLQREPKEINYWSGIQVAKNGVANVFSGTDNQAIDELEKLLNDAVRLQMMADVPLGAFLSGGVDSSTIVALMQAQSTRPVKTYTIGFEEGKYNEAEYAKAIAAHLGTEHTELYVTAQQTMSVIPQLPYLYDEPFSDSSQIPTFIVSQLARQHVTVSLSGEGGDELFCGYNRYQITAKLWKKISCLPIPLRELLAKLLMSFSPDDWNRIGRNLPQKLVPVAKFGDKLHKGARVMSSDSVDSLYYKLVSNWHEAVVIDGQEPSTLLTGNRPELSGLDPVQRMMILDMLSYIPDDILVKVDRAAMGVSLESRVPFLDHRVVEFAWRLPQTMKLRDQQSKWILRQILYRHVPQQMIERPKMGFGIPVSDWLRGSLRDWAESLLDESRLHREGFLYPAMVRKKWSEHLSGKYNWSDQLWDVLMFQAWLEASHA